MKRRNFIHHCLYVGAGTTILSQTAACSLFDVKELNVGKAAEIANKPYFITLFNRKDIFIRKTQETWEVFSLICRHKKCTVEYKTDIEQFICPCHDGVYDKNGKVLSGPPPAPLKRFKVEERNGDLWVINEVIQA